MTEFRLLISLLKCVRIFTRVNITDCIVGR